MPKKKIQRIKTINEFHRLRRLPKPEHPLISLIDYASIKHSQKQSHINWVLGLYTIALKRNLTSYIRYGQQEYDFDEGMMSFVAPGQVLNFVPRSKSSKPAGFILHIHPDFLWNTPLAKAIKQYEFFDYSVYEALFLSEKEEIMITGILKNIEKEYHANIDKFSHQIIISQIEVLLNYAERFYERQFITRKITNHKILTRLEKILDEYFKGDILKNGLPSVQYIADELHVSPRLFKQLTQKPDRSKYTATYPQ